MRTFSLPDLEPFTEEELATARTFLAGTIRLQCSTTEDGRDL